MSDVGGAAAVGGRSELEAADKTMALMLSVAVDESALTRAKERGERFVQLAQSVGQGLVMDWYQISKLV